VTTTTTSCIPSQTVSALPETGCSDNTPEDRSKWCGKSVGDDTHVPYESGDTKKFALLITSAESNFDGTSRPAFLINGGTPGPVIEANYGDWVEVTVTNLLTDNATTIHWHGIRQIGTNDQDGVPGVTECAIPPLGVRTYRWLASTYGTGWYHSHALSQYGGGIRGPVIIHGPSTANYDYDMGTVMVDEIFSQTIFQMAWNIARLRGPLPAAVNYMLNGKNKAVDGTKGKSAEWTVYPGKKHLFRIINSSAQASYVIHFDNHKMQVISADYTPIVPYTTDTLYINPGQRYNVVVEMNQVSYPSMPNYFAASVD
jgi:FtsP/CotA-like multicopper oxidase with cupredoxin domain